MISTRPARVVAALLALLLALTLAVTGCDSSETSSARPPGPKGRDRATPAAAFPATPPAPLTDPADDRPNILMISADDMRADEIQYMPKTRRLLGEAGLTLTKALTPHPLCCPARAELMTGQYAQNNGVRTNFPPQGGFVALDRAHTIGGWMHDAGYNTSFVGKHLNSANFEKYGRDPGWTLFDPTQSGYSDYYDFIQYNNGDPTRVRDEYYTDYVRDRSVEYVHELSEYDAPFFMWVSHFGPHSTQVHGCDENDSTCESKSPPKLSPAYRADRAAVARDKRLATKRTDRLWSSAANRERDLTDKQHYVTAEPAPTRKDLQALVRGRIGALRSVDDAIAKLLGQVRADGELANTYVVFITDNGYLLGEHGYVGKVLGYEPALRTPMLVRGPGVRPGSRSGETVTLVDLAATYVDIAGATPDLVLDGRSLKRLWHGKKERLHRGGVLILAGALKAENGKRGWYYRGIRTDRYTLIDYYDGFVELYDRRRDPQQVTSVAGNPRYATVQRELDRRLAVLQDCNGADSCDPDFGGPVPAPLPG